MLNTVKVVCELCKPFEGSHSTVFFNLFYTSIILMKFLDKISLHVTGTVIKNRLPEEVKINKTSQKNKECIFSQIGLKLMKVALYFVESREALFRYMGLSLLVIITTIWGELILRTQVDCIVNKRLWDCIGGG